MEVHVNINVLISKFKMELKIFIIFDFYQSNFSQSAGAVEYTNCISAEGQDAINECLGYDTKQSDGEVPLMLEL